MKFFNRIILPLHEDAGGSGLVAEFDDGTDEIGLVEGSEDEYFLPAIKVQSFFDDEFRIFFQLPAVHVSPFFRSFFSIFFNYLFIFAEDNVHLKGKDFNFVFTERGLAFFGKGITVKM